MKTTTQTLIGIQEEYIETLNAGIARCDGTADSRTGLDRTGTAKEREMKNREAAYQDHVAHDDERGFNLDGCYYCGGSHPSDCCSSSERDEYWNDSEEN
jgi:hypothetical protein